MKNRIRNIQIKFYVSDSENEAIKNKMDELGIKNKSAYIRKMSVDGYIIKQDFESTKKLIAELNKIGSNINQIAKVANTYGANHIFEKDLQEMRKELQKIWQQHVLKD